MRVDRRIVDERETCRAAQSVVAQKLRTESSMKQQISQLESLVASQQSDSIAVGAELLAQKQRVVELQSQLTTALLASGEQKHKADEQIMQIARLQSDLSKINAECVATSSRVAEYSSNVDYWRTHYERQLSITQQHQSQIEQLNAQLSSLQSALNESRRHRTTTYGNARNCNHTFPKCKAGDCSHDCCHR